jgi:molybdopterin synthase sulfur carrier subunit
MAVRVRLFAAIRQAAGTGELEVEPAALPDLLADLVDRFGEPFASRLALCTVLVGGRAVPRDRDEYVADGTEVALLPPVSGGSHRREPHPESCARPPGTAL